MTARFLVLLLILFVFGKTTHAQPPKPMEDPNIKVQSVEEVREELRATGIKLGLSMIVVAEKLKPRWKRDNDKIAKLEAIIESESVLEFIQDRVAEDLNKHFEARGPPTAKELGDGVILEKILEWIKDGGLEDVLKFILALIDAFAENREGLFQNHLIETLHAGILAPAPLQLYGSSRRQI